jgi:hypothetical protein
MAFGFETVLDAANAPEIILSRSSQAVDSGPAHPARVMRAHPLRGDHARHRARS